MEEDWYKYPELVKKISLVAFFRTSWRLDYIMGCPLSDRGVIGFNPVNYNSAGEYVGMKLKAPHIAQRDIYAMSDLEWEEHKDQLRFLDRKFYNKYGPFGPEDPEEEMKLTDDRRYFQSNSDPMDGVQMSWQEVQEYLDRDCKHENDPNYESDL